MAINVASLLKRIGANTSSGAAEILEQASQVFFLLDSERTQKSQSAEDARRLLVGVSADLVRGQPAMAPLVSLANQVIVAASKESTADLVFRSAANAAAAFLAAVRRGIAEVTERVVESIAEGATILTHSRSSTVLEALLLAHQKSRRFCVIATESRPMFEGRVLASALAREGIMVTLIADAAAASVMNQATCVLVGADQVSPTAVTNKIGTRMVALAAREVGVPVYAAADASKFLDRELDLTKLPKAEELWPDAPAAVCLMNLYFEKTPLDYFACIITENGQTTIDSARRQAEKSHVDESLLDALSW